VQFRRNLPHMKLLTPLVRILALVLVLSFAGLAMFQDSLLYYPERVSVAELAHGVPGARPWPSAGDFRALVVEPAQGEARATVVVFHGNAGHAGHRGFYAEALAPLGVRVILAEYPGYGPRSGDPGEASFVTDAAATIAAARREFGGPLLLLGESLGAGVAAAASKQVGHEGIAGIVLVTPWDTLANVAAHHYSWLPRSLLAWGLRDRYDSVANLSAATFRGRVSVVLAERDSIVPAAFGQALFDSLSAEKRRFVIAGAEHNDWPAHVSADWWSALVHWQFMLDK
jgi:alpha-beta hydrolase superfamily lysophospholipase